MPGLVCRVGDKNAAGGVILTGDPTVLVNGRPVATIGARVTPHAPRHPAALTTSTNKTVLVGGKPITTVGDIDTCGHPRLTGSTNVIVGK
jgi:uncharacterized Zn-binding protein involved in type VI secretion